jgi:hypothetical protein
MQEVKSNNGMGEYDNYLEHKIVSRKTGVPHSQSHEAAHVCSQSIQTIFLMRWDFMACWKRLLIYMQQMKRNVGQIERLVLPIPLKQGAAMLLDKRAAGWQVACVGILADLKGHGQMAAGRLDVLHP